MSQQRLGPQAPGWAAQENGKEMLYIQKSWGGSICCCSVQSPTHLSHNNQLSNKVRGIYFSRELCPLVFIVSLLCFCMYMCIVGHGYTTFQIGWYTLYLKVTENFMDLIFKDSFWFVNVPFVSRVEFRLIPVLTKSCLLLKTFCAIPVSWGCRIHWLHLFIRGRTPYNKYPRYDTKNPRVRLQLSSFREYGVLLHCHYSQVHSDSEW